MKKETRFGVHHVTSDKQFPFINASQAMMAMQMLQFNFALQGNLTTSSINLNSGRIGLTIYLEGTTPPVIPSGYKYTWKDISSHEYWSDTEKTNVRVRCIVYYFEYNK